MPPQEKSDNRYLDPTQVAALEGLHLRARKIVEGYISGMHRSPMHGFSHEFAEHRQYVPGDDLRHIDWKVFARTDKYYLKRFEEETNLICYLLLDTSSSMRFSGSASSMDKLEYASTALAALAYLIISQQDSISLATFDTEIRDVTQPGTGRASLGQVIQILESADKHGGTRRGTAIAEVFHQMAERFRRRGIIVIFSDLFDETETMLKSISHLIHRGHEVLLFHILDRSEIDFRFTGPTIFNDLESELATRIDPRTIREAYIAELDKHIHAIRAFCRQHRVEYISMPTDKPMASVLTNYLITRSHKAIND